MANKYHYLAKLNVGGFGDTEEVEVVFDNPVGIRSEIIVKGVHYMVFVIAHTDGGGTSIECDKM